MTEYVIRPEGAFRRDLTETPIQLTDTIAEQFTEGVTRKVGHVLTYGGNFGSVGLTITKPNYMTFSVQVVTLPLRCHCNVEAKVMVPVFDNKECPMLPMQWKVPNGMRAVLVVNVSWDPHALTYVNTGADWQYLVAFDNQNRTYRLPLSNLFEDCKLCHNIGNVHGPTAMDVVRKACEQFEKSEWNDHLYKDATPERRQSTKQMFRWKPTDDTFQQLPMELPSGKDWTALCSKVAIDKLTSIIIPPSL